ncbi:MAG: SDR family NAD(P)-dependent oxidoreductase, partial [Acidimicrobiales bacterium]
MTTSRVALVTGTAHGIGRAIADTLEEAGHQVHRVDKEDVDITDGEAVTRYVEGLGPIDILVNNA